MATYYEFLEEGKEMGWNDVLYSKNNLFKAILQEDGNFVVYYVTSRSSGPRTSHWSTWTHNEGVVTARMQKDGNFTLWRRGDNVHWASNRYSREDMNDPNISFRLSLSDLGQLVIERHEVGAVTTVYNEINTPAKVKSMEIYDTQYDMNKSSIVDSSVEYREPIELDNRESTADAKYEHTYEHSVTEKRSWTNEFSFGFSEKIKGSFRAKIPGFGSAGGAIELGATQHWKESRTFAKDETKKYSEKVTTEVPAHSQLTGLFTVMSAKVIIPYQSKVKLIYENNLIGTANALEGKFEGFLTFSKTYFKVSEPVELQH